MEVYRLSRKKHATELSGKGAAIAGGRWNFKGTEMIYTAQNRALAMAEVLVHLPLSLLPKDFVMITIEIPNTIFIETLDLKLLENDWYFFPNSYSTQMIGSDFIKKNKSCVLKVPSVVVQGDFNYIINPYHIDFKEIKIIEIIDFPFDKRIFK